MENNYFELDEFQNIYLEDSFVINIQETKSDNAAKKLKNMI